MVVVRGIFRTLIGILFGIGSALALTPAFAAFTNDQDRIAPIIMIALIPTCGAICLFAPTIRRALGRGFLMLGASVFLLPISAFLLSGRAASGVMNNAEAGDEALAAVGAGLAGVAVTGIATFIGIVLGSILLLIGLILSLGGRREVVLVEETRRREPTL